MDRPSSTACSWTLSHWDPDRHFQLVNDDGHAFDIWEYTRDGKRSSVAKVHDGLHLFLARDSGHLLVCGEEEGHFFPCRIRARRVG
jgi:hypothetical protein